MIQNIFVKRSCFTGRNRINRSQRESNPERHARRASHGRIDQGAKNYQSNPRSKFSPPVAKGDEQEIITNVVIKEFTSVKECARYMGVNNLLDRTMKASEKVTLASKQNEVIEEITKISENEEVSTNTVIKTCSGGYTITTGQWNDLVRGKQIELPEIDLNGEENHIPDEGTLRQRKRENEQIL